MEAPEEKQTPFDERTALEELERLHQQIVWQQSQRRKAEDDFEQFVRSFKPGAAAAAASVAPESVSLKPELPLPGRPESAVAARPGPSLAGRTEPPASAEPAPPVVPLPAGAAEPQAEPPVPPRAQRSRRTMAVTAAAMAIIATGGFLAWTFRDRAPETPAARTVTEAPAPAAAAEPRPTAPAQPARRQSELTTIRPVWIRVIVDGERVLEREVPGGTTVALAPRETLVIRAGDAGAVRLTIAGQDRGFLGREGEVVTRTFAVPASPGPER